MTDFPRLWLRCGRASSAHKRTPNLADIRPGDLLAVNHFVQAMKRRRVTGDWVARVDNSDPTGWSFEIGCRQCGAIYPVSGQEISEKLELFTATGERRGTWYLSPARLQSSVGEAPEISPT